MRKPRIEWPIFVSTSFHEPHGARHLQQVLLVKCSGVGDTRKRLPSLRIIDTPMVGAFPFLTPLGASVAPHAL